MWKITKTIALGCCGASTLGLIYASATAWKASPSASNEDVLRDGGIPLRLRDGRLVEYFNHGDLVTPTCTIVALHGLNTTGRLFSLVQSWAMANHVRIVAPTLPGFGLSDFKLNGKNIEEGGEYSMADWVSDIEEVIDHAKIPEGFHVVGTSFGGKFAAALASLYPQPSRIKNVMLYVPMSPYVANVQDPMRGSMLESFANMRQTPFRKRLLERILVLPLLRLASPRDGDVARSLKQHWEGVFNSTFMIYADWSFPWQDLSKNRKVFVVSGLRDEVALPHNQTWLVDNIRGAQLVTFDGRHADPISNPSIMEKHFSLLVSA